MELLGITVPSISCPRPKLNDACCTRNRHGGVADCFNTSWSAPAAPVILLRLPQSHGHAQQLQRTNTNLPTQQEAPGQWSSPFGDVAELSSVLASRFSLSRISNALSSRHSESPCSSAPTSRQPSMTSMSRFTACF
ncbi:hypothetical protein FOA52_001140 [Chlamydomonas sp. UWO 241]|nr:hypothetical protein FOA52_001140 [Chlamydomonas sp. UWO 241]